MSRPPSLLRLRKASLAQAIARYMGITPLVRDATSLSPERFILSRIKEAGVFALESGPVDCELFLSTDFSWYWRTRSVMTGREADGWEPNRWGAYTTRAPSGGPYPVCILAQVKGRVWDPLTTPPYEGPRRPTDRPLEAQLQKLLYRLLLRAIWGLGETATADIREAIMNKLPESGE